ncbi:hypothetical protein HanIR_Chr15g0776881 [Helianthus annuus]|nr:hypothetical protein HanIR_Chr15g0776881 [Helianthus annuus]
MRRSYKEMATLLSIVVIILDMQPQNDSEKSTFFVQSAAGPEENSLTV